LLLAVVCFKFHAFYMFGGGASQFTQFKDKLFVLGLSGV